MNLTAIFEKEEVYIKHFYDSILLFKTTDFRNQTVCDIGSGAGFPGMVIALMEPTAAVTLLEPIQKKARFLQAVKEKLGLENVRIIAERAEDFAKTYRSGFSIVSSRAVAHLPFGTVLDQRPCWHESARAPKEQKRAARNE